MATSIQQAQLYTDDKPASESRTMKWDDYVIPTEGILSYIPLPFLPVAELVRLDKPGFVYIFVPMLFGALYTAAVTLTAPALLLLTALKLLLFAIPFTFINYSWNDTVDADFDRQVWRTRHRPIARGAISKPVAHLINIILLSICTTMWVWGFPLRCLPYAALSGLGCFIYPLTKRITMFPQVIFGFVIGTGIFLGASALGTTPFLQYSRDRLGGLGGFSLGLAESDVAMLWLYAANVSWAICYEIIYSFQDVAYDAQAGVGTVTLLISERRPKRTLALLATLQVIFSAIAGWYSGFGFGYFLLGVFAMGMSMVVKISSVNLADPQSCIWWFSRGALITGSTLASGLLVEYLARLGA